MKNTLLILILAHRITKTHSVSNTEPLGLLSLAESAKSHGYPVNIYSGDMYEIYETVKNLYDNRSGNLVTGLYCDFENQNAVSSLTQRFKMTMDIRVAVGGPQAVALGESFLRDSGADMVFRGEGEHVICQILDAIEGGNPSGILRLPGICAIDKDGVCHDNGISPPIADLDALPVITGTFRPLKKAMPQSLSIITGRGCPFRCSFCYEGENGKNVRMRGISHVMQELQSRLSNNPYVKYVCFVDDTFTLNKDRVRSFCAEIARLRKEYNFVWFADGHVNAILKDPHIVREMVEAGLVRMQIGIESCSQAVIDIYEKNINKDDLFRVVEICKKAGLPQLAGNIIIGGALETPETLTETFETVKQLYRHAGLMLDVVSTFYTPYPLTAMSREPEHFGITVRDWEGLTSQGDWPMVETSSLSLAQISTFRDDFFSGIVKLMRELVDGGQIPDAKIMESHRLARTGLQSLWMQFAFSGNPAKHQQYKARARGGGLLGDYPDDNRWHARPQRTLLLSVNGRAGNPTPDLYGYVLSPLEKKALLLSSGKRTLRNVENALRKQFGTAYGSQSEWEGSFNQVMQTFEDKGFITMEKPLNKPMAEISCQTAPETADMVIFRFFSMSSELSRDESRVPSVGVYHLAAWLEKEGFDVRVCECRADETEAYIRRFDISKLLAVGFSADYETQDAIRQLSKMVKAGFNLPVIVGGPEAAALEDEFLRSSCADAVVVGEGEIPLTCILTALRDRRDYHETKGIRYIGANGVYADNGIGEIVENLDDIPFPAYHRAIATISYERIYMMSGRGCPYACAFCHESVHKRKLRRRSVQNVLAEARSLLRAHPELSVMLFCDDTLVVDPVWLREFCTGMKSLRQEFSFNWYCEADAISLDKHPDLIDALKDAGLGCLQIGIESADQKMLDVYEKRITPDMVERVVKKAYAAGIPQMYGAILVGGPFENPCHIEKNKAFIEKLMRMAPGMIELSPSLFMPYPLTKIGKNPEKYGLTVTDPGGLSTLTDYPVVRSREMDEDAILQAYQDLVMHSVNVAGDMLKDGSMGHEELMRSFAASDKGFGRYWSSIISRHNPSLAVYYTFLTREAAKRFCDVDPAELPEWRSQRLVEIWRDVNFRKGWPELLGVPLSPLEFDLLTHCTGKLTIRETAGRLYDKYGKPFGESKSDFTERIIALLKDFESRYQMIVVPF